MDIAGKRCFIIGGGRVAERKCGPLVKMGAKVTVISPEISQGLERYKRRGLLRHIDRNYRTGDIKSAFLVIASTDSDATNRKVVSDAGAYRVLLNVVDNPSLCNFIVPSVLRQGPLTIAVSSGGASPAMARSIRKRLGGLYGSDFSRYLKFLGRVRPRVMEATRDKKKRGNLLKALASDEIMEILFKRGFHAARTEALGRLQENGIAL